MQLQPNIMCGDCPDTTRPISGKSRNPRALAKIFLALADPIRLRMLNLMLKGEVSIYSLAIVLQQSPCVVTKHLAHLRAGGLVAVRRRGNACYYSIRNATDGVESDALQIAFKSLKQAPELEVDQILLEKIWKAERKIRTSKYNSVPAGDSVALHVNGNTP